MLWRKHGSESDWTYGTSGSNINWNQLRKKSGTHGIIPQTHHEPSERIATTKSSAPCYSRYKLVLIMILQLLHLQNLHRVYLLARILKLPSNCVFRALPMLQAAGAALTAAASLSKIKGGREESTNL